MEEGKKGASAPGKGGGDAAAINGQQTYAPKIFHRDLILLSSTEKRKKRKGWNIYIPFLFFFILSFIIDKFTNENS